MVIMSNEIERQSFSERLNQALKASKIQKGDSPSAVAREFNARYTGKAVTLHAVRKWMVGEAIPSQSKIVTLSNWLGVPPDWLRFGTISSGNLIHGESEREFNAFDEGLYADIGRLTMDQKRMVREFIALLLQKKTN